MADTSFDDLNSFNCPICLQLLVDPITTACGHSFCMNCIKKCWDVDDQKGVYSCPQCRQIFTPRPTLSRSTVLTELVEKMRRKAPEDDNLSPLLCSAGSGDVECDICIGTKLKAIMFCKMCVASYCEYHIQNHYTSAALKRHKLVNALPHLLEQICDQHDKPLELYCCKKLICTQCAFIEHQSHTISTPATSRKQIEVLLNSTKERLETEKNHREIKVQELRQAINSHRQSAQATVEHCVNIFTDGIKTMKKQKATITQIITNHEKAEVSVVEKHIDSLEQEIANLINGKDELEQISKIEDDIFFIQKCSSFTQIQCSDLYKITVNQHVTFEKIQLILSELKSQLNDLCEEDTVRISEKVPTVHVMESQNVLTKYLPSRLKTREEFLIYSSQLSLKPSSACYQLKIKGRSASRQDDSSQLNLKASSAFNQMQTYGGSLSRQDGRRNYGNSQEATYQVLCNETLSGRCFFEVNWTGSGCSIAFSYDMISKGGTFTFGSNNRSWKCDFTKANVCVLHHNTKSCIPLVSKIGVFLDTEAGTVSFYNVSDKMTLLHRIQTTFTEPLYPGFSFQEWGNNSTATIV